MLKLTPQEVIIRHVRERNLAEAVSTALFAVISHEDSKPEILSRIAQTTAALTRLKPVWIDKSISCLLYTSPSPRDRGISRMPSSA